jgi:hypothetical protein
MQTGAQGRYKWLETDLHLREFLSRCPATILGKHIAITAVDSGSFWPSQEDRAIRWIATGASRTAPPTDAISNLPAGMVLQRLRTL